MPPESSPGLLDRPARTAGDRAARVRFRRAVALMLMTLVLPGLGPAGRRQPQGRPDRDADLVRPGREHAARRSSSGCSGTASSSGSAPTPSLLGLLRLVLMVLAIGWAALLHGRLADRPAARRLGMPHRRAVVGVNGLLSLTVAGALLFGAHLVGVQRDFIITMFGDGAASGAHARPLQRAAARRRLRRRPLGAAAGLADRRQHRRGHRPDRADRPAAQHGELPVRRGLGDGRAVPRRVRLRRLLPQRRQHLGARTTPSCSPKSKNPGVDATIEAVEGITGLEDQLLGDGQPRRASRTSSTPSAASPSTSARRSPSAASAVTSPATSSPAPASSTASTRSGSPAPARAPTTTRGWPARSA